MLVVVADAHASDQPRDELLAGVESIIAPGVPGPLCAVGSDAHVIVTGRTSASIHEPVVVAGSWGRGRVVVFGHGGYLGSEALDHDGTSMLLSNAARWASGRAMKRQSRPVRAVVIGNTALASHLSDGGFNCRTVGLDQLMTAITETDLLVVDTHRLNDPDHRKAIQSFVKRGGGLLTAGLGWGWQQLNPDRSLVVDHPGNQLLAGSGIVFADGYLQTTHADGYDVVAGQSPYAQVQIALELLRNFSRGAAQPDDGELAQASAVLTRAIQAVPDHHRLLDQLDVIDRTRRGDVIPTEQSPLVATKHPLERVLLTWQMRVLNIPLRLARPHPAADSFPGAVATDVPKVRRILTIDCRVPDWHSTGLYVPPGVTILITIPEDAGDAGLHVRIGAHKDELWHKPQWKRVPEITTEKAIDQRRVECDTLFGGLLYIVVPNNCPSDLVEVSIHGAVEAPLFVLGDTDLADWRSTIRHAPGAWGELATDKIVFTLPSRVLRTLDDPETLMQWWDTVLDAQADLRAIDRQRRRPERVVCDVQISAGYMHAGYPIMTHLDVAETFVSLDKLQAGDTWGIFHELGHNHQHPDWTFAGTVEVTCNLFTLYSLEHCCVVGAKGHDAVQPEAIARRIEQHQARGATFESWKSDPFLALIMYIQLQREFGWDTYKEIFAEYESLPAAQRPRSEQGKRDQWMVRFSRAVGRNLGPFFQWWGVPTSDQARQSISDLPVWMPAEISSTNQQSND